MESQRRTFHAIVAILLGLAALALWVLGLVALFDPVIALRGLGLICAAGVLAVLACGMLLLSIEQRLEDRPSRF